MENVLNKTKTVGKRIFYNPNPLYSYEYLVQHSLSSNTFRGFHRIDKSKSGAGQVFRDVLNQQSNLITQSIINAKSETDIDLLSNELKTILKLELAKNTNNYQLQSFNKIRKPIDIVLEHMVSMFDGFAEVRQKIIPFLFLPLDSQMFMSTFVFSDLEIKELKLKRSFSFKDIWDKSKYQELQKFLKEKAEKLEIDRIFFDLAWNERYNSIGGNLFDTNPRKNKNLTKTKYPNSKNQAIENQKKLVKTNNKMEELSYTEKGRKTAQENKLVEKLNELKVKLLREPVFSKYSFSKKVDVSHVSDYCIWLTGFNEIIGIQMKHQPKSEKIVINLRPINYNRDLNDPFIKLMNKKSLKVQDETGEPYIGIQKVFTIPNYKKGILREDYQEIKSLLNSTIEWIKAIK